MYFPQTTIYSICSNCGGEGSWYVELPLVNPSSPAWGGTQRELISVFSDFPAGRNLQPNAHSCCKGGISPPQTCLQATVLIRGSGGFGSPLLLATKGSFGAYSSWKPLGELLQQGAIGAALSGATSSAILLESTLTRSRLSVSIHHSEDC